MATVYRKILSFYQKIISPLFSPSCRYYPSCSEYAKWQFDTNSAPKAFVSSAIRIMRCNKLFDGGIDYPQINYKPPKLLDRNSQNIKIKYWFVKNSGSFAVIKSLK